MEIDDAEVRLELPLQFGPLPDRADVVAQVDHPGRLNAGEHPGPPRRGVQPLYLWLNFLHHIPLSSRSFAAGSGLAMSAVPIRTASTPSRSACSTWARRSNPLSLTTSTPAGISGRSRAVVSRSTRSVLRSRLLMPTMSAPASTAAAVSSDVCTSTSAASPHPAA